MEIQYTNIFRLEKAYKGMYSLLTPYICNLIDEDANGILNTNLSESEEQNLFKIYDEVTSLFSDDFIDMNLFPEIDLNIANIENDNHLIRYLTFIRNKVQSVYELSSSLTNFENYHNKYWGDIMQIGMKNESFTHPEKFAARNPITNLRIGYLRIIEQILTIRDHIDEQLKPGQNIMSIIPNRPVKIRDAYKDWRLVIPDPNRRVAFDKWTSIMSEVRQVINKNAENITKINAYNYKVGGGNKEFDDLISWGSDLTSSVVPDRIISHEIMNEIDVNLLELKTQREKNLYLAKLKSELEACVHMFKGCLKTHPDYQPREEDSSFDEETSELAYTEVQQEVLVDDWRVMFKERNKYSLQMFYIHLLIIVEVLENIIRYIEGKTSPEEEGRLAAHAATSKNALTSDRHKLLLLHKLGLFEILKERYMNPSQPLMRLEEFAELIAALIDAKSDNLRSEVGKLKNEIDAPNKPKLVQTDGAIKKVNAFLASIGLPH